MKPWIWKLTLSDGTNKLELEGTAKWLYGSDYDVEFQAAGYVNAGEGELLDNWEQNKTQLSVELELESCVAGDMPVKCSEETVDYYSQSGKGTIEWEVGDSVKIRISFQGEGQ